MEDLKSFVAVFPQRNPANNELNYLVNGGFATAVFGDGADRLHGDIDICSFKDGPSQVKCENLGFLAHVSHNSLLAGLVVDPVFLKATRVLRIADSTTVEVVHPGLVAAQKFVGTAGVRPVDWDDLCRLRDSMSKLQKEAVVSIGTAAIREMPIYKTYPPIREKEIALANFFLSGLD